EIRPKARRLPSPRDVPVARVARDLEDLAGRQSVASSRREAPTAADPRAEVGAREPDRDRDTRSHGKDRTGERHLEDGCRRIVADEEVGDRAAPRIRGAGLRDAEMGPVGPAAILDRRQEPTV